MCPKNTACVQSQCCVGKRTIEYGSTKQSTTPTVYSTTKTTLTTTKSTYSTTTLDLTSLAVKETTVKSVTKNENSITENTLNKEIELNDDDNDQNISVQLTDYNELLTSENLDKETTIGLSTTDSLIEPSNFLTISLKIKNFCYKL